MISRRQFIATSSTCVVLPYLQHTAFGQGPGKLKVRKNMSTLPDTDPFFEQYGEAVKAMHMRKTDDPRSWWGQATIHPNYCEHGTLNFCSFHRPYITMFEEICGDAIGDPSFTLHYWDWSTDGRIPDPFFTNPNLDVVSLNDPGKYTGKMWGPVNSVPQRGMGRGEKLDRPVFTKENLETIQRQTTFADFTNLLEGGPHNVGHVRAGALARPPAGVSGGHMYDGLSPLDPLFWTHHCMVDKTWAQWQAAGNTTEDTPKEWNGVFVNGGGKPVNFTSEQVHDFKALGFTYDVLVPQTGGPIAMINSSFDKDDAAHQRELATMFSAAKQTALGRQAVGATVVKPHAVATITVAASGLVKELQQTRVFKTGALGKARFGFESMRVQAILEKVTHPETDTPIEVNVFVNCPYLDDKTPTSDEHYAGSFSFFGKPMKGMKDAHNDIIIDITAPLQAQAETGRVAGDVMIQLVSVTAAAGAPKDAIFTVAGVQLVSK